MFLTFLFQLHWSRHTLHAIYVRPTWSQASLCFINFTLIDHFAIFSNKGKQVCVSLPPSEEIRRATWNAFRLMRLCTVIPHSIWNSWLLKNTSLRTASQTNQINSHHDNGLHWRNTGTKLNWTRCIAEITTTKSPRAGPDPVPPITLTLKPEHRSYPSWIGRLLNLGSDLLLPS